MRDDGDDLDELSKVVHKGFLGLTGDVYDWEDEDIARAVLKSAWLTTHDAEIRTAALAMSERDLAKAWYEGWCAGERWRYWVEREDPINHQDVSMSANPYGDYTPPENERESNWPTDA